MRKFLILAALLPFAFACERETTEVLDQSTLKFYAIVACGSETDLGDESPAEWAHRMADIAIGAGLDVLNHELGFEPQPVPDQPICGNCMRTGDVVRITVPLAQESPLRELGFVDL